MSKLGFSQDMFRSKIVCEVEPAPTNSFHALHSGEIVFHLDVEGLTVVEPSQECLAFATGQQISLIGHMCPDGMTEPIIQATCRQFHEP